MFAFLLSMTRNEADTHDVLQEVFTRLSRDSGLPNGVKDERAFLIRMVHNALIDFCRRRESRRRKHEKLGDESTNLFATAESADERKFQLELNQALEKLPRHQRAVVHLKLWEDMTFAEIATSLDISPNTAASRYRYGIDKLRTILRPLYEETR